ncbi:metallophosphoesterase [Streptomyces sp. NPDC059506]|uniref:metallophosphoesterase family protein n=1 Tax=unclassified Streptomyces TaxID=2593676 RepID=UPI0015FE4E30|nr:metallophosphoesterase [Streptomyces sp. SCUT-3]QMV22317.1 hypothetical protein GQS52_11515 [Streptomyces sp. SCUT-3]
MARVSAVLRALRPPRLRRPSRTSAAAPFPVVLPAPGPHPLRRALGLLAVTVAGGCMGLGFVGGVEQPVGPVDTVMSLRPSFTGGTEVAVPPLGSLELSSHHAPLRLRVDVDRLDPERAGALVDRPERLAGLDEEVARDVRSGATALVLRSSAAAAGGAAALGLAVYRRPRRALLAGGLALALMAGSGLAARATWNPTSVLEPKFSGLLSSAPNVVGNARSIVSDFDAYQQELASLVTNVTKLYEAASSLPAYSPDPTTLRVLHVSDIHLNPAAWEIVRSMVDQYGIDVIVDTGDLMDHGTKAENGFTESIGTLGAPYVWVRGNHDSEETQKAVARQKNAHVVDDGKVVTVEGLRIAGIGDPQFTPDRSVVPAGDPAERRAGRELAASIRAEKALGRPVDIAVAHNPVAAAETAGTVPLALAGHTHRRDTSVLEGGTRLFVQGSTGGGGLRAVEDEVPQEVQASVLYLDRDSHQLQAWDDITLGGLGLSTAEVSRHLPPEGLEDGKSGAEPSGAPGADGAPGPSGASPEPSGGAGTGRQEEG